MTNTNTTNTADLRAALIEARDWFESQAKAVSKGCGSSYELHDLRVQRDALDAALAAAPAQPVAVPCPFPCGWVGMHRIAVADGAYLAGHAEWPEDEDGVSVQRATVMRTVGYLIDICRAALSASQAQPVATEPVAQWQKRHPNKEYGLWQNTDEGDAKWWRDKAGTPGWEARALYAAPQPAAQALDSVRVFWQQHTQADALSMTMAELHDDVEIVIRAARRAAQAAPKGWVPCVITYEGQHPEEVAYGPKIMMERLQKWLDRYFKLRAQPAAQAAPVDAAKLPSPANVGTAPKCLNLNDQAMWVLGWNECIDAARAAHGITAAQKGGQDAE